MTDRARATLVAIWRATESSGVVPTANGVIAYVRRCGERFTDAEAKAILAKFSHRRRTGESVREPARTGEAGANASVAGDSDAAAPARTGSAGRAKAAHRLRARAAKDILITNDATRSEVRETRVANESWGLADWFLAAAVEAGVVNAEDIEHRTRWIRADLAASKRSLASFGRAQVELRAQRFLRLCAAGKVERLLPTLRGLREAWAWAGVRSEPHLRVAPAPAHESYDTDVLPEGAS